MIIDASPYSKEKNASPYSKEKNILFVFWVTIV